MVLHNKPWHKKRKNVKKKKCKIFTAHLELNDKSLEGFWNLSATLKMNVKLNQNISFLFTHSLCFIYFSQFIHQILFSVSANQSLYQFFFQCHIAFILLMPTILIQNGGHQQYKGNVTLKEKPFLSKASISRNVEQNVMNKL